MCVQTREVRLRASTQPVQRVELDVRGLRWSHLSLIRRHSYVLYKVHGTTPLRTYARAVSPRYLKIELWIVEPSPS